MARQEKIVIQTRLGEQSIDESKIIYFPKGIIGFEDMHEFTLLQINEDAPMLILQSISEPSLGLLVADPYSFLPDYSLKVGDAEQKLLCLESPADATVLVTVTIPHGKPHLTSLNLTGPILINAHKKIGLQVPQSDAQPSHVMLEKLMNKSQEEAEAKKEAQIEKTENKENVAENQKQDKVEEIDEVKEVKEEKLSCEQSEKTCVNEIDKTNDDVELK